MQEFTAFDKFEDFPEYRAAWTDARRNEVAEELAEKGVTEFLNGSHAWEWNQHYRHNANVEAIRNYCDERNIPCTHKNLVYAFLNLKSQGQLVKVEEAPTPGVQPQVFVRKRKPGEVRQEDVVEPVEAAEPPDTGDEAKRLAIIARTADTAQERKAADTALKQLAINERYARRTLDKNYNQVFHG